MRSGRLFVGSESLLGVLSRQSFAFARSPVGVDCDDGRCETIERTNYPGAVPTARTKGAGEGKEPAGKATRPRPERRQALATAYASRNTR
jgi:hypothetical protein